MGFYSFFYVAFISKCADFFLLVEITKTTHFNYAYIFDFCFHAAYRKCMFYTQYNSKSYRSIFKMINHRTFITFKNENIVCALCHRFFCKFTLESIQEVYYSIHCNNIRFDKTHYSHRNSILLSVVTNNNIKFL